MKKVLSIATLFVAMTACGQIPYKVTVPVPDAEDGTMAYMVNYDTGDKVDSAMVKDQKALFTGDVDEPYVVRFIAGDKRYGTSILEEGSSTINQQTKHGVGSMLNDQLTGYINELNAIAESFQSAKSEEEGMAIYQKYLDTEKKIVADNIDSPIGYYMFIDYASSVDGDEMMALVEEYPQLKDYKRVQGLIEGARKVAETSAGKMFKDFEVTYNGKTYKLSDYVGKGHYTLVDFWASWCGPCRREMATLKEIYNEYKDKGLEVLGVAVWDEPEATEAAIKQLDLPWPCIINSQTIATDIYGIPAIPCVILFGPDGKILSRGLQGAQLKAEVAKYMAN
ncbi:MAG: AhpC/TSA family protein [Muribaculaceae bacterium]|nr:AhpC/TSA family protein [Muribaculaceae bacterium]